MIRVSVDEARTHLSQYLDKVEAGETMILCRHNRPVAEVRPINSKVRRKRVFGVDDGFGVSPKFSSRFRTIGGSDARRADRAGSGACALVGYPAAGQFPKCPRTCALSTS